MPHHCAFGCKTPGTVKHLFPNPNKHPERFQVWLSVLGKKADDSNCERFRNKRVCDIHFAKEFRVRNNRLSSIAIPTLHLPGNNGNESEMEMAMDDSYHEITEHTDSDTAGNDDNVIEEVEVYTDSCFEEPSTTTLPTNYMKDNYQDAKIIRNILEHNYSVISKTKVLQIGDEPVHNVTTECYLCHMKISTQYNLQCFLCKSVFDYKCLNITSDRFKSMTRKEKSVWICPPCVEQEGDDTSSEDGTFVNSIYKRVKILDSKDETNNNLKIKRLKKDIKILKSQMYEFSNTLKQTIIEYDRRLKNKDEELHSLKEIVAELQNCISKKQ